MKRRRSTPNEPFPALEPDITARENLHNGERVRVVEAGPSDAFPIVLLHGWGGMNPIYYGAWLDQVEDVR